jgi:hypothetical protein
MHGALSPLPHILSWYCSAMFKHNGNTLTVTEDGFKNPAWSGLRYSETRLQILKEMHDKLWPEKAVSPLLKLVSMCSRELNNRTGYRIHI